MADYSETFLFKGLIGVVISIYVYHFFVPHIIDPHLSLDWIHSYTASIIVRFAIRALITLAIAEISWVIIEKPIMKWKNKFSYSEGKKRTFC